MALYTMVNGKETIARGMGYSYGAMVQSMMGTGSIITHKAKANFITLMVIFMKENGLEIKQMVLVNIVTEME